MTLGSKLSKLRRENNFTQEQLAEILGVSRQAVSKWESDSAFPETEKLLRLGDLYHCSMDYLLKDAPEASAPRVSFLGEGTDQAVFLNRTRRRMDGAGG